MKRINSLAGQVLFLPLMLVLLLCTQAWAEEMAAAGPGEAVLADYNIYLRLGDDAGPVLDRPVVHGDVLFAQSWVPLMGRPESPMLANLIWQLYDIHGQPIHGFGSVEQLLEMGGEELVSYKMSVKGLANGHYYLALTHQQALRPDRFSQAMERFEVLQEVAIRRLVVDDSPLGKEHHDLLFVDQAPHIFAYYSLADSVTSGRIVLDVLADGGDKVLATRTVVKQKDYMKEVERVGVRFEPGFFPAGKKFLVRASVTAGDGAAQAQTTFSVQGFTMKLSMPSRIRQGQRGVYSLETPASFMAPFQVEFQGGAVRLVESAGLQGQLEAVGAAGEHEVQVTVVDSNGRRAMSSAPLQIVASPGFRQSQTRPAQSEIVSPHYQVPDQGGRVGSSSPQNY